MRAGPLRFKSTTFYAPTRLNSKDRDSVQHEHPPAYSLAANSRTSMTYDPRTERIGYDGRRLGWSMRSFVGKSLALAAAAVFLLSAIAISIVAFVVIVTGILVVGAYIWWKTRD